MLPLLSGLNQVSFNRNQNSKIMIRIKLLIKLPFKSNAINSHISDFNDVSYYMYCSLLVSVSNGRGMTYENIIETYLLSSYPHLSCAANL